MDQRRGYVRGRRSGLCGRDLLLHLRRTPHRDGRGEDGAPGRVREAGRCERGGGPSRRSGARWRARIGDEKTLAQTHLATYTQCLQADVLKGGWEGATTRLMGCRTQDHITIVLDRLLSEESSDV